MSVTYIVFRQICVMALLIFLGWTLAHKGTVNKVGNGQLSGILTNIITKVAAMFISTGSPYFKRKTILFYPTTIRTMSHYIYRKSI